jgi:hypothetical protein
MDDINTHKGDSKPQDKQEPFTRAELLEQFQAYIDNFEKLPQHEKFSFALLCDVYYPLLIILEILKEGERA